jgi:hypothetical protein
MKKDKKKKTSAITQQNLKESREEIISKGKKFRYPFQYAKHRLVIVTILISIVALVAFATVGYVQLYKVQSTSEVMYRYTKVFPFSVAKVDGVSVRYSDYLMLYRSSKKSVERQQGSLDGNDKDATRLRDYYKRQALTSAEEYSYALAKLNEMGKSVSDSEIDAVINEHKTINGEVRSDSAFSGIVRDNFGLSMGDYRRMIMLSIAKKNYSMEIDSRAKTLVEDVAETLKGEKDFAKVAEKYKENDIFNFESLSEMVDSTNLDSGRAATAFGLKEVGDVSDCFVSKNGDGYYFVKLTERNENKVKYDSIWIRFTEFGKVMNKIREENKIEELITVEAGAELEKENGVTEKDQ